MAKRKGKMLPAPETTAPAQATSDEILARIETLRDRYAPLARQDEEYEELYFMERPESDKEGRGVETIIAPDCHDAINLAVDLMSAYEPVWEVAPLGKSRRQLKEAEGVRDWIKAAIYHLQRRSQKPFIPQLFFDAFLYGRYCLRLIDLEKTPPDGIPFRIQRRNVKYVWPDFDDDGRLWALVEAFPRPASEIRRVFGKRVLKAKSESDTDIVTDDEMVDWCEYWDENVYVYFANGEEVGRGEHGYGEIPYIFRFGRYAPHEEVTNQPISLLHGARNIARKNDLMLTTLATAALNYTNSALAIYSDRTDLEVELGPNKINYFGPQDRVEWIYRQGGLPDLERIVSQIGQMMSSTTFKALGGDVSGVASGFLFNQASRAERHKTNPVRMSVEWALGDLAGLMFRMIDKLHKTVEVTAPRVPGGQNPAYTPPLVMTPDLARAYKQVYATVPPDYLEDMATAVSLALQSTAGQKPLLDLETARKRFLRIHDPAQVEEKVTYEKLRDMFFEPWLQYVMQRKGIGQQAQPGGQPGAEQSPGNPQAPFDVQANNGQPETTPQGMGMPPSMLPDETMGVPPAGEDMAGQLAGNINQTVGMGMDPQQAAALLMARGTPQATGRG